MRIPVMVERKIWYDARKSMKMAAEPRRYHGQIAKDSTAQMKKPRRMLRYFGHKAAISFPALRER
jgi:hypothetical protein